MEDCAAEICRAPSLGALIKLGEWFGRIDYTALTHESWIRHRVRVRLFRPYHRGMYIVLHMRQLVWKRTVFDIETELPHICQTLQPSSPGWRTDESYRSSNPAILSESCSAYHMYRQAEES
jgi:hypothetical protein